LSPKNCIENFIESLENCIEKNNTLLFAFGQKGPLVLTITEGEKCIVVGFGDEKSETGAMTAAVGKLFSFVAHIRTTFGHL